MNWSGRLRTVLAAGAMLVVAAIGLTVSLNHRALAAEGDEINFDSLIDVGSFLEIRYGRMQANRRTGAVTTQAVVTNNSSEDVACPLLLVIGSITDSRVTVNNETGTTPGGDPYFDLSGATGADGVLSPGESTSPVTLSFQVPSRVRFRFDLTCLGSVVLATPQAPTLDPYTPSTTADSVTITGTVLQASVLEVAGLTTVQAITLPSDGTFTVLVALSPNRANQIFFTGINATGARSAPATATVIQDEQAPSLQIQFPGDLAEITTPSTDVAGIVGDLLSGFDGLDVTVNGATAEVDIGIGTNGTFFLPALPLALGANTISASATDILGNTVTRNITVTRVEVAAGSPTMEVVSGNAQRAQIHDLLADPIVVRVLDGNGDPFPNKIVTFDVTRSDGRLSEDGTGDGSMMFQARTDALGLAGVFWHVGTDAGCGNNRVEVRSESIVGTTAFCATATPAPAQQINISTGNNQRGEAGAPAPLPLRAWVSDGCNGVEGVSVVFVVTQGQGRVNGEPLAVATTGPTGHAEVDFAFGITGGNDRVTATFTDNASGPAVFALFSVVRDEALPTTLGGLVLDNAGNPIGGARVTVKVNGIVQPSTISDGDGIFAFSGIADGAAHLRVDGTVANSLNGTPIPGGSFPALGYELVIVPNADNSLPTPVLLPPLNPANAVNFDNTQDVILTVEEIEGLEMTVTAGSMTRADGSVPSASDPAVLTLNQVHFDDLPMPVPDGAAPPFAWTLQPAGATFDPPIQISYPNMSALPPGSIAFFLSFNHATGNFEIVAPGTVTDDGSTIISDPGTGLTVAGWGCNCPPYSVTADCENCAVEITSPTFDPIYTCPGDQVTFTASGAPTGGTYAWTGGTAVGSTTGASYTATFATTGDKTVTVAYTCDGTATTDSCTVKVELPTNTIAYTRSLHPDLTGANDVPAFFVAGAALTKSDDDGPGDGGADDDVCIDLTFNIANATSATFPDQSATTFPAAERFDFTDAKYNDITNFTDLTRVWEATFSDIKQVNSINLTGIGGVNGAGNFGTHELILAQSALFTTTIHESGHNAGIRHPKDPGGSPRSTAAEQMKALMYFQGIAGRKELNRTERTKFENF